MHSPRFTSDATPPNLLTTSMMASCCSPIVCFSRGRMPDSKGKTPAQSNQFWTDPKALTLTFGMNTA